MIMGDSENTFFKNMEKRIVEWFLGGLGVMFVGGLAFYIEAKATANDVQIMKTQFYEMKHSAANPELIQEQIKSMNEIVIRLEASQRESAQNSKEEFRIINERMNKFSDTQVEMFKYIKK